ncbi:MAG: hypothetical protein AAF961_18695 [Planctomycetota bacterium]
MSVWIPRRDAQGRLYYYTISVPLLWIPAIIGILMAALAPVAATMPLESLAWAYGLLAIGFALFLRAKASLFEQGIWFSFGSGRMTPRMRRLYRLGYCLMIPAAMVAFSLCLMVVCMYR